MSENGQKSLQRLDLDSKLPSGFASLSEQEKCAVMKRLQDQDIEIRGEMKRKVIKSQIAEHDLALGIDTIQHLDHERKIYSKKMKGETGSGTYELNIRGGDTKFIVPILAVVGIIVLGIILVMGRQ